MKNNIILLLCLITLNVASGHHDSDDNEDVKIETFEQFKAYFHKEYDSEVDEQIARENFEKSKQWIAANSDKLDFDIGITSFADEFSDFDSAGISGNEAQEFVSTHSHHDHDHKVNIPEHFDWREHIWMSRVISQGKCGSCWAFTSAVMMEANLALRHNISVMLSKQELIDCTVTVVRQNKKCHGGHANEGFRYVQKHGIHGEIDYPLKNMVNETHEFPCQKDAHGTKYTIKEYHEKKHLKDHEIQEIILQHGPVSVLIVGTDHEFRFYKGGVLKNFHKNPSYMSHNHEAILVGWGHDSTENIDYWILRNSWGTWWGEKGYARIQRGINSIGINDDINYLS